MNYDFVKNKQNLKVAFFRHSFEALLFIILNLICYRFIITIAIKLKYLSSKCLIYCIHKIAIKNSLLYDKTMEYQHFSSVKSLKITNY